MAVEPDHIMEVKVSDTDGVTHVVLSNLEAPCVGGSQARFILLCPKEVYRMDRSVLLNELQEMALERRL